MKKSIFVLFVLLVACGKGEPTLAPTVGPLPSPTPLPPTATAPPTWTPEPTSTVWATWTPVPSPTISTTVDLEQQVCDEDTVDQYADAVARLESINASLKQQEFADEAVQSSLTQLKQLQDQIQGFAAPCDNAFWLRQMLTNEIGIEVNKLETTTSRRRNDAIDATLIERLNISLAALREEVEKGTAEPGQATAAPPSRAWDCSGDVYDCSYFHSQQEAQQAFEYCLPKAGDVHQLDEDGNGLVCESLP